MMPDPTIASAVLALTGATVRETSPLPGGCIGTVTLCRLADGDRCVVKQAGMGESLANEVRMLGYLAAHSDLPIPQVLGADDSAIVMSYLPQDGVFDDRAQAHAGELIAALHLVTAERFGLDFDTQIGPLPQPNPWSASWLPLLRDHRLVHMADLALDAGQLPPAMHRRMLAIADRLDRWVGEPQPSLLHGDLWVGNVLACQGRISGFVDPAIYYGDAEMDLALATLFGPFGRPFFEAYRSVRPLDDDFFAVRRDVYTLYPLLMHVRLVGAPYTAQLDGVMRKLER